MKQAEYEAIIAAADKAKLTQEQRDILWGALIPLETDEERHIRKDVSVPAAMQAINRAIDWEGNQ